MAVAPPIFISAQILCARARRLLVGILLSRRGRGGVALDDLVKLAAVKPNAAAPGAIVDLNALTITHRKRGTVDRAGHRASAVSHLNIS
jgi:hypothetical protein